MKTVSVRCVGCGRVIEADRPTVSNVVRIALGSMHDSKGFQEKNEWGLMHRIPCFVRAINSPENALEEIRAQAQR